MQPVALGLGCIISLIITVGASTYIGFRGLSPFWCLIPVVILWFQQKPLSVRYTYLQNAIRANMVLTFVVALIADLLLIVAVQAAAYWTGTVLR